MEKVKQVGIWIRVQLKIKPRVIVPNITKNEPVSCAQSKDWQIKQVNYWKLVDTDFVFLPVALNVKSQHHSLSPKSREDLVSK